jgi:hypothetical protein
MNITCKECKEVVPGVEIQVLSRGYEQPTPYVFHQKCYDDLIDEIYATEGIEI